VNIIFVSYNSVITT